MVRANDRTKIVGSGEDAKTVKVGGMMVAFSLGLNVEVRDPNKRSVQTLYSVLDNTRYRYATAPLAWASAWRCIPAAVAAPVGITAYQHPRHSVLGQARPNWPSKNSQKSIRAPMVRLNQPTHRTN